MVIVHKIEWPVLRNMNYFTAYFPLLRKMEAQFFSGPSKKAVLKPARISSKMGT